MTTLIEFLTARLDEDEAAARAAIDPECPGTHWQWVTTETDTVVAHGDLDEAQEHQPVALRTVERVQHPPETGYGSLPAFLIAHTEEVHAGAGEHIVRHDPARVLREVAAKRAFIADFKIELQDAERYEDVDSAATALRLLGILAAVYSDHPNYNPEWTPE